VYTTVYCIASILLPRDAPTVPAVLHYTSPIRSGLKHGEYVGFAADPVLSDPALPRLVDSRVARQVHVQNARTTAEPFTLARHGFEIRRWPTRVRDFADSAVVLQHYVPEIEALVSASVRAGGARGIRAVVVWDLCLRSSELINEFQVTVQAADAQVAGSTLDRLAPVPLVHADFYSPRDVYRRLRQRLTRPTDTLSTFMRADFAAAGLSASDLERCMAARVMSVNVWRSIDAHHPVRRCPLALCDPGSLTKPADELVPFEIHCPDVSFAEAHVLADGADAHEWYHFPEMRQDECLVFVSGDTAGAWPAAPHSSFDDPRSTDADPPRRSIEARVFVIFDE
tara:strand:- start:320 stop:1339 length:1020 start_codon:yes stop_codon:yes gene_type:complete